MQPQVSFALIVLNEETKLPDCLKSFAPIANEIIVVEQPATNSETFGSRILSTVKNRF
jgi:hypothetical protein